MADVAGIPSSDFSENNKLKGLRFRLASSHEEIQRCQSLRHAIFVQEQKVPAEVEYDGKDDQAFHVLCEAEAKEDVHHGVSTDTDETASIVATGRMLLVSVEKETPYNLPDLKEQKRYKSVLGRIAVRSDYRGGGLGRHVVWELERIAKANGAIHASLTPHHYLEDFYARLGYHPCPVMQGENRLIHVNEHCQLIAMEKRLL